MADGFSDSDQEWWDRLSGRRGEGQPASAAEREADALKRELQRLRQALPLGTGLEAETSQAERQQRWLRTRERLQREGLLQAPRSAWRRRAVWGGALAASVAAALLLVPRHGDETIYGRPPAMRGDGIEVLRRPAERPRAAAEALARSLAEAGAQAALYQEGRVFIVDVTVHDETPAAAIALLKARGARAAPGVVRIEYAPG